MEEFYQVETLRDGSWSLVHGNIADEQAARRLYQNLLDDNPYWMGYRLVRKQSKVTVLLAT